MFRKYIQPIKISLFEVQGTGFEPAKGLTH